jgi:hypothetical protein
MRFGREWLDQRMALGDEREAKMNLTEVFLRLGVGDVDLHTGAADSTPLAPAALYVFAFASGFAEQLFFGKLSRVRA